MKIALFTVAYKDAEPFIADFLGSVAAQVEREFDLLVLNDGANPQMLAGITNGKVRDGAGSVSALRREGIAWMRSEGYDLAVFADIDDRFDANRLSLCRQLLHEWDIVVNELVLFGENITLPYEAFDPRLREGQEIREWDLRLSNCMGMSNTAARLASIAEAALAVPDSALAFDWGLYARALIGGARSIFTRATNTSYRQHGANVAGLQNQTEEQILRGVGVKAHQYAQLSNFGDWYADRAIKYGLLMEMLQDDAVALSDYCARVRAKAPVRPFWWESIRLEEELS